MILRTSQALRHVLGLSVLWFTVSEASQLRASRAAHEATKLERNAMTLDGKLAQDSSNSPGEGALAENGESLLDNWLIRPNAGSGPDMVEFGIYLRELYSVEMKVGKYNADVVMTWRWRDERNIKLIPEGHHNLTISLGFAKQKIWLPDVGITNHEANGLDIISSAVVIEKTGVVTKVERAFASLMNSFSATAFPFDSQVLTVTVGSKTFMQDDLQLSPMKGPAWTGVKEGVFNTTDFVLADTDLIVFEEVDGMLRKSRGQLRMTIDRDPSSYIGGSLVPELLVIAIAYTVFWFPLLAPFAMPRVATALIAFLSLMTLALKTNAIMPRSAGLTWIDLFETSAQSVMFFTVCLNILALAAYHTFECKTLAERINHELKLWYPLLVGIIFGICGYSTRDGVSLAKMTMSVQCLLTVFAIVYIGACLWRLYKEVCRHEEEKKAEEAKKKEAAGLPHSASAR